MNIVVNLGIGTLEHGHRWNSSYFSSLRRLVAYRIQDRLPAREIPRHELSELGRRRGLDVEPEFGELAVDLRHPEDGAQLVAPGLDQRRRRPGRGEEDRPAQDIERGVAKLGAGPDVGCCPRALGARGEQDPDLAGAMV